MSGSATIRTKAPRPTSSSTVPGRTSLRLQWRDHEFSTLWRPRPFLVTVSLGLLAALLVPLSLGLGDYPISFARALKVILTGEGTRLEQLVVLDWRMPRALSAIAVGCSLGLAGCLTQSVTRNPLASPDILGITSGASAMAVTVIVFGSGTGFLGWLGGVGIALAAFAGAVLASIIVWLLSWKAGADTFRLVLCGIIITSLLSGYISFVMIRAELHDASTAQLWLTGSLSHADWNSTMPVAVVVIATTPLLAWIAYLLLAAVLGRDIASALGQRFHYSQLAMLVLAVALSAFAVSAAGPIGFVAFVAPQLAQRLCGVSTPPLVASAFSGAVLLIGADSLTQSLLTNDIPVGIVTSIIGGVFLLYLLVQHNRKVAAI